MNSPTGRQAVVVRPAAAEDIPSILGMDYGYSTDYVWQMELREEDRQLNVAFREVRLPRSMRVTVPRNLQRLETDWAKQALFIVAEVNAEVQGYLAVSHGTLPEIGIVGDFVVNRRIRRQGIGTTLIASARDWAGTAGLKRLIIETQSKNYPAICFCRKHGFVFCGYNDRHYPNQDIALYFGVTLK